MDIFTLLYPFSPLSPSLWETARYRLKYCLKGPLNPKQPTNQPQSPLMASGGWSGSAMVLGKLPVPGRPTILITVGQGPTALATGAGGDCLDIFTLIYPFSPLSPTLWETARYRLKSCLKGPLNPKQPTNQALGNLPLPGRPTIWMVVGRVGVVWTFLFSSILSLLCLPLFGRRLDID